MSTGRAALSAPNVLPQLRLALAARRVALALLAVAAFLTASVLGAVLLVPGLVGPLRVRVRRGDTLLSGLLLDRVEDADEVVASGEGDSGLQRLEGLVDIADLELTGEALRLAGADV